MKAKPHELSLLHNEGYIYHRTPYRGWYYHQTWIVYNSMDALIHRANLIVNYHESMEGRRIQSS